jgi:DNA-binding NarL/FixJ family response regulator
MTSTADAMTGAEPIRVLVVDDQELVRTGFCVILEAAEGITVIAEAGNGVQAVQAAAEHKPDVILMDVRMPEMDGLEATRQITGGDREAGPRVVMLTTFDFDDYVYDALRAGASGFLLKDAPRHDLIAAVRVAAEGNGLLAPSVTMRLIDAFARHTDGQGARHPAAARPRPDQRGDRGRPRGQRGHGQVARREPAGQARAAGPGASRHPRLRDRHNPPRRAGPRR